jgi:3-oxoacyl-[acyl-carrier protein] reductase
MDLNLSGKVAHVAGGSRGLGWATAQRLAAEGCHVGNLQSVRGCAQRRATELRAHRVQAHGVVADVTRPGDQERLVDDSARTEPNIRTLQ